MFSRGWTDVEHFTGEGKGPRPWRTHTGAAQPAVPRSSSPSDRRRVHGRIQRHMHGRGAPGWKRAPRSLSPPRPPPATCPSAGGARRTPAWRDAAHVTCCLCCAAPGFQTIIFFFFEKNNHAVTQKRPRTGSACCHAPRMSAAANKWWSAVAGDGGLLRLCWLPTPAHTPAPSGGAAEPPPFLRMPLP